LWTLLLSKTKKSSARQFSASCVIIHSRIRSLFHVSSKTSVHFTPLRRNVEMTDFLWNRTSFMPSLTRSLFGARPQSLVNARFIENSSWNTRCSMSKSGTIFNQSARSFCTTPQFLLPSFQKRSANVQFIFRQHDFACVLWL
jgi:hypothetical protein